METSTKTVLTVVVLVVLAIAGAMYVRNYHMLENRNNAPNGESGETIACTMDARQCPDGTWVGRTGPNCEFVCPGYPPVR